MYLSKKQSFFQCSPARMVHHVGGQNTQTTNKDQLPDVLKKIRWSKKMTRPETKHRLGIHEWETSSNFLGGAK